MKIKKEYLEKARVGLGVACLIALALSVVVIGLPAMVGSFGNIYLDSISTRPPYNFLETDSLLQIMIHRLEQRGLTQGEIDPYFHRFGNMETRYQNLVSIQGKIRQLAFDYPKPPQGVTYDYKAVEPIARPLLKQARSNAYVVEIYDMFHAKRWWTLIFFVSVFGTAYGFLDISKS